MSKSKWYHYDNLIPGRWRGKKRGNHGKVTPGGFMEVVPGAEKDWYKPFNPRPIKHPEKRGQSKPR